MKITLEKTSNAGWLVQCGDRFSSHLGNNEALGLFASFIYGGENPFLPYLRTYAETTMYDRVPPFGLLPETVRPMPRAAFIIYRRELLADLKGV